MVFAFQNCSKVGFRSDVSAALKATGDGELGGLRAGDDGQLAGNRNNVPGDDGAINGPETEGDDGANTGVPNTPETVGKDPANDRGSDLDDDADWLYIPGGRGHVPMGSVAICPADSKDAGKQECPFFCYKGVDYVMHRSEARNYFAKKFAELPNYGGGAVPGTCANPDLKTKK